MMNRLLLGGLLMYLASTAAVGAQDPSGEAAPATVAEPALDRTDESAEIDPTAHPGEAEDGDRSEVERASAGGESGEAAAAGGPGDGWRLHLWLPILAAISLLALAGAILSLALLRRLAKKLAPAIDAETQPPATTEGDDELAPPGAPALPRPGPAEPVAPRPGPAEATATGPRPPTDAPPGRPVSSPLQARPTTAPPTPPPDAKRDVATEARESPGAPAAGAVEPADEFIGLRHAEIGRLLRELHGDVQGLAREFTDDRLRRRFLKQLDMPLATRIERFKLASPLGEQHLRDHWLEQDLVSTLDSLSQFLSEASAQERLDGPGGELKRALMTWLYDILSPACKKAGWFGIDRIEPFVTEFDPKIHNSIGTERLDSSAPVVVSIRRIGRRDPSRDFVATKAEVVVGC